MAHLLCGRQTQVWTQILIPLLCLQLGLESEFESVQCEYVCIVQCSHWVRSPNLNLNPNPNSAV